MAKIATDIFADRTLENWRAPRIHASDRGHDLTRRAIAALQSILIDKRLLHRMQRVIAATEPFNGCDRAALD